MRIHITQDIFRNRTCGMWTVVENSHWVQAMVRQATKNLPVMIEMHLSQADGGKIDTGAIMDRLGVPRTVDGWARMVCHPGIVSAPELADLHASDLVIGFGLTHALMNGMAAAGVRVIDIEMSSYRFGRRQYLRARTTCPSIAAALASITTSEDELTHHVQAMAGRHARSRWYPGPHGRAHRSLGILAGQVHADLAIVENGRLASLEDDAILERLRKLASGVEELYVLPHPSTHDRLGNLHRVLEEIPNAILDAQACYAFLTDPATQWMAALSSGTLSEAEYFGVTAHRLILPDRDNPALLPKEMSPWKTVHDTFFSPQFWRAVVEGAPLPRRLPLPEPGLIAETLDRVVGARIDEPPHDHLPTLASGTQFSVNQASRYGRILRFGWHDPEPWGTWSMREYVCIAFRVQGKSKVFVELLLNVYAPHPVDAPDVRVRKPGSKGFEPLRADPQGFVLGFEVDPLDGGGLCSIIFQITVPKSPWSMGESGDTRPLGIAVSRVTLRAAGVDTVLDEVSSRQAIASSDYYTALHTGEQGYRSNNWLAPYARALSQLAPQRVVECGTGNGAFATAMAVFAPEVIGLDWAPSSKFPHGKAGVSFLLWDAMNDSVPEADLVCSADFLEHIPPARVQDVLGRMLSAAKAQFHIVACYDDGHSHLTIEPAASWLERFMIASSLPNRLSWQFRICDLSARSADAPTAVITNIPPEILDF
ncbi:MAG: class I SAM-dependent methyltransferase [Candidatus Korobacteraceae bacterium]